MALLAAGVLHWRHRLRMQQRLQTLGIEWSTPVATAPRRPTSARDVASRLGARLGRRMPSQVDALGARMERAGLAGQMNPIELLGWKGLGLAIGVGLGLLAIASLS